MQELPENGLTFATRKECIHSARSKWKSRVFTGNEEEAKGSFVFRVGGGADGII